MQHPGYRIPRILLPETVWKIGKASSSTSPEWTKGVEKPYFAVLCHRTNLIENPFGYFPNSFSGTLGD
jgi:hypothetical protein